MLSADFFHTNEKVRQLSFSRDEGAGRTVEVVWVCHVVYFVFGVKIIREEE